MNWVDHAILAIISISALISVIRGFVKEALSLLGWIAAFWVALAFAGDLAARLVDHIPVPSFRNATAFLALFLAVLFVAGVVNFLAGKLVEKTGLSGTDRALGIVFGAVRGVAIVGILVLLAGLTALPEDPWWDESVLMGRFEAAALEIRAHLPEEISSHIRY